MKVVLNKRAQKQFSKLDSVIKKRVAELFDELELSSNPRSKGKALAGGLSGLWRYRVGDYRVVCDIADSEMTIYAIKIAHRKEAY